MMSSFDTLNEMDPATRAFAEVRAREAGMSLAEWLGALVHERAAPQVPRRFYGGGGPIWAEGPGAGRSLAISMGARPASAYDMDVAHYMPILRYPEIERGDLNRIFLDHEVHEVTRSALHMIALFPPRISHAAILLSAAFAEADVQIRLPPYRPSGHHKASGRWYHTLVDTCLHRSREVRNALMHEWTPSGRAELMWGDAFATLCDLTSARQELLVMFHHDRSRASVELAKHLDVATQQFELSANLLAEVDTSAAEPTEQQRFTRLREALLERAGGGVSLTEGAKLLNVSRQALHKRIKAGTALGMMDGDELVLPRLQWVTKGDEVQFLPGLTDVVRQFERAGGWSALQFLLDHDPNLAKPPIQALREGSPEKVVAAARAYLGLDEE
uniref:DNA-binding protein n=1 Tax=Caulobacter sp. (strain K31) TaxID=366602 RepID=B0T690_CAUSK